jgi:hypothetical protein
VYSIEILKCRILVIQTFFQVSIVTHIIVLGLINYFATVYFLIGAAVGFRLDSLLKLTDTRATNNKMTLMHYLCKVWHSPWNFSSHIFMYKLVPFR